MTPPTEIVPIPEGDYNTREITREALVPLLESAGYSRADVARNVEAEPDGSKVVVMRLRDGRLTLLVSVDGGAATVLWQEPYGFADERSMVVRIDDPITLRIDWQGDELHLRPAGKADPDAATLVAQVSRYLSVPFKRVGPRHYPSPHPLGSALPALFQEDPFTQQLTAAMDAVLAPILTTLDNLDAYVDPSFTPVEFLDWLGGWVALVLDEHWDVERRRAAVRSAAEMYRMRGTRGGLAAQLEVFTGGTVEIVDNGGVGWSPTPGTPMPGKPQLRMVVRVKPPSGAKLSRAKISGLVAASKPAHIPHEIEVIQA